MRTHQISSSGYLSADKVPDLYKTNLEDAQRDLKTTPVDIDGVSLKPKTREKIAEKLRKTEEENAKKIAKQNAKTIEEKNSEKQERNKS